MRNNFFTFLLIGFASFSLQAQAVKRSAASEKLLETTASEEVYVHYNSSLLFPGEYFLYRVYTLLNDGSSGFSDLSKIAYVELIGEDGNLVFSQKVKLEGGTGQADFFVPTDVPSGNYKLISYTNWMKNQKEGFFEADIVIINPYQSRQKNLLEPGAEKNESSPAVIKPAMQSGSASLELPKSVYGKREKVSLKINGLSEKAASGKFSLSVRKINDLGVEGRKSAVDYVSNLNESKVKETADSVFLPELRGHLVTGEVRAKEPGLTKKEGIKVALSLGAGSSLPNFAVTNEEGKFYFNLDTDIRAQEAVVELMGTEKESYEVKIVKHQPVNASSLNFGKFYLSPEMEDAILERSIYNQVENAYFSVKPDTIEAEMEEKVRYEPILQTYKLDDYKRFKTVPETFVEVINSAWIKKDGEGKMHFEVRGVENNLSLSLPALVVIDGVLIQDHDDLAYMNAAGISEISIIREKVYLGPQVFQGAVLVKTNDGSYFENHRKSFSKKVELELAEIGKNYFVQKYEEGSSQNHIPDFRYQLAWIPQLELQAGESSIEFYTSDVEGSFEVVLEGFSSGGEAFSLRKVFRVEDTKAQ